MKIFGFQVGKKKLLTQPPGHWHQIWDTTTGRWQQDTPAFSSESVLTFSAVFACIRLISSDIGKLRLKLVQLLDSGIWREISSTAFSPVLRKPNGHQTRIKFFEQWVTSKLINGNAYVLKGRDNRGVVTSLKVLEPTRVQTLVSDRGEVFYRLKIDNMIPVPTEVTIPATEIIHDVHLAPWHPLVGVSPIIACGLSASQGIHMQTNSEKFFENRAMPGGILTAPGHISDDTATRLKTAFVEKFTGDNAGKLAVVGDGLKFESIAMNAVDSQFIEQLRWTGEDVCRAFGVPAYKVGIGQMPSYNNIEALQQAYYSETLQELIECIELLLDEGCELPSAYGTEFDLDGLLRMDSLTLTKVLGEQIKSGLLAPDEGRQKLGYDPVPGGQYPYLQQQNFSLEALAKRDAQDDPFKSATPKADEPQPDESSDEETEEQSRMFKALLRVASC